MIMASFGVREVNLAQEAVKLKLARTKLLTGQRKAQVFGLAFARFALCQRTEGVTTDRLLVFEEAVRVLNSRA